MKALDFSERYTQYGVGDYNTGGDNFRNDRVSSIWVKKGFEVTIYEHVNRNSDRRGAYRTLRGPGEYKLNRYNIRRGTSWDNQISSIRVTRLENEVKYYENCYPHSEIEIKNNPPMFFGESISNYIPAQYVEHFTESGIIIFYVEDDGYIKMILMNYNESPPQRVSAGYKTINEENIEYNSEGITGLWNDRNNKNRATEAKDYNLTGNLDELYIKVDYLKQFAVNKQLNKCIILEQPTGPKFYLNGDTCNDGRGIFERNYSDGSQNTSEIIVKNGSGNKFSKYSKTVENGNNPKDEYEKELLCLANNGGNYDNNFNIGHTDSCEDGRRIGNNLKQYLCDYYPNSDFCSESFANIENFTGRVGNLGSRVSEIPLNPDCAGDNDIIQLQGGDGDKKKCSDIFNNSCQEINNWGGDTSEEDWEMLSYGTLESSLTGDFNIEAIKKICNLQCGQDAICNQIGSSESPTNNSPPVTGGVEESNPGPGPSPTERIRVGILAEGPGPSPAEGPGPSPTGQRAEISVVGGPGPSPMDKEQEYQWLEDQDHHQLDKEQEYQ